MRDERTGLVLDLNIDTYTRICFAIVIEELSILK